MKKSQLKDSNSNVPIQYDRHARAHTEKIKECFTEIFSDRKISKHEEIDDGNDAPQQLYARSLAEQKLNYDQQASDHVFRKKSSGIAAPKGENADTDKQQQHRPQEKTQFHRCLVFLDTTGNPKKVNRIAYKSSSSSTGQ
jgi:hypothetical protein